MNRLSFASKINRDNKAKELAKQGIKAKRSSFGSACLLHPMYLEDLKDSVPPDQMGLGNTMYKTFFKNIYHLEWED